MASKFQKDSIDLWDKSASGAKDVGKSDPTIMKKDKRLAQKRIQINGVDREYLVYIPSSYSTRASTPLVLNFHGFGSSAFGQLLLSDWRSLSDQHGFILVYPQGAELASGGSHWNPNPVSEGGKSSSDDLGFIEGLIDRLSKKYSIDLARIFATGFSNGAGMAYGLAHNSSELIAAIAPVSGLMSAGDIEVDSEINPVAIASFNGSEDLIRPIGGINGYLASVHDSTKYWAKANKVAIKDRSKFNQEFDLTVKRRTFSNSDGVNAVQQYIIRGGGHDWFNININNKGLDEIIWEFLSGFEKHDGDLVPADSADIINLRSPQKFKRKFADTIIDFNPSKDTLEINPGSFGIRGPAKFRAAKNMKRLRKLAKREFDFLYDQNSGGLYFNENGSDKGFGDGGIVAILMGSPDLNASNLNFNE